MAELRDKQKIIEDSNLWITSALIEKNEQGKCADLAAGEVIMISPRMRTKIHSSDHVSTIIAWVRLHGPICTIFFIVVYIPHK